MSNLPRASEDDNHAQEQAQLRTNVQMFGSVAEVLAALTEQSVIYDQLTAQYRILKPDQALIVELYASLLSPGLGVTVVQVQQWRNALAQWLDQNAIVPSLLGMKILLGRLIVEQTLN